MQTRLCTSIWVESNVWLNSLRLLHFETLQEWTHPEWEQWNEEWGARERAEEQDAERGRRQQNQARRRQLLVSANAATVAFEMRGDARRTRYGLRRSVCISVRRLWYEDWRLSVHRVRSWRLEFWRKTGAFFETKMLSLISGLQFYDELLPTRLIEM